MSGSFVVTIGDGNHGVQYIDLNLQGYGGSHIASRFTKSHQIETMQGDPQAKDKDYSFARLCDLKAHVTLRM